GPGELEGRREGRHRAAVHRGAAQREDPPGDQQVGILAVPGRPGRGRRPDVHREVDGAGDGLPCAPRGAGPGAGPHRPQDGFAAEEEEEGAVKGLADGHRRCPEVAPRRVEAAQTVYDATETLDSSAPWGVHFTGGRPRAWGKRSQQGPLAPAAVGLASRGEEFVSRTCPECANTYEDEILHCPEDGLDLTALEPDDELLGRNIGSYRA